MSIDEIKLEIFRQVDALDNNKLKELYGLMQNYLNSKKESDEWYSISTSEKDGVLDAINEIKKGKIITHQQVMSKLRKKYLNA